MLHDCELDRAKDQALRFDEDTGPPLLHCAVHLGALHRSISPSDLCQ